ncbi:sensor histidine kinase [Ferrovibrio xuzhouensis]|uniref:histidine kinase n=1 Tax=Ferrovibrio xuzhouensis TaxID=1576914 RepID=A0ABV7VF63_9PROT
MSVTDQNSAATGRRAAPSELVLDAARPPFPSGFRQILLINAIATLFCASVICLLLWRQTMADWIAGWWLLHLLATSLILIDWYSRRPRADAPQPDTPPVDPAAPRPRWRAVTDVALAAFCGLVWGISATAMPQLDDTARMLLVAVAAGMIGGSAAALALMPLAGAAFILGIALPFAAYFLTMDTLIGYGLAGLTIGYVGAMVAANHVVNGIVVRNKRLHRENIALYDRIGAARSELLDIAESSEAFAFFDGAGRLLVWNRRFPALLGIDAPSLRPGTALPPLLSDAGLPVGLLKRLESAAPDSLPVLKLANGHWVRAGLRRSGQGDRVVVLVDITEQQAVAAALRDQNERLAELFREVSEARDVALRANHAKSGFLANMSHEMRTPLNAIIGFSDIIRHQMFGEQSPKYRDYAEDIHGSGQHLLGILDDILDLARIEASRIVLDEQPVQLAGEIATCARLAGQQFGRGAGSIIPQLPDRLPPLHADARLVRQILINLIGSALKFSPPGLPVEVGAQRNTEGEIELWVRDHGIGFAPADQARIFEPFEQLELQRSRRFGGLGLGLSLVRAFVAAHQGRVAIDSQPGRGTRITAVFPAARTLPPSESGV